MSLNSPTILTCHLSTPCAAIHQFAVRVWRDGGKLALQYRLDGDINALEIPPTSPSHRTDGLWQTTCCELFIKGVLQTDSVLKKQSVLVGGYYEFNFSPSTAWAAYAFSAYRQGMVSADLVEPVKIAVRQTAARLELDAVVNVDGLALPNTGKLHLGLSAVVQQQSGAITYWAFAHPEGKPDFHHLDGFVCELA